MPIIKIRNKTGVTVFLNSENTQVLLANETKICFYNRPMLFDQTRLRVLLRLDHIEFLNEFNDVVVKYNQEYEDKIEGDDGDFVEMLTDLIFEYQPTNLESFFNLKRKIADKIEYLIKFLYIKGVNKGTVTNYTTSQLITALNSKNVIDLLNFGDIDLAGKAVNQITSDEFFTNGRKSNIKAICDSVIFE